MQSKKPEVPSRQQRGGVARRERLSSARLSEIASQAARARWQRDGNDQAVFEIEDLQMNTDTIDAADILVTELNEQVVTLSRSGARALESGQIAVAKSMIRAIENTQGFLDRAEQLKTDISAFYDRLVPQGDSYGAKLNQEGNNADQPARRQNRTDRAALNAKRDQILHQLELEHGVRLNRRSSATYRSEDNKIGIVCTISKWYADGDGYWYAYHTNQDRFLDTVMSGYFVLGMMDTDSAVVLPLALVRENLDKLSTTALPGSETYWHINVDRGTNGALSLHRARGAPSLPLDPYVVRVKSR